ncbi:2-amino-4-hydroxy-6-hydroxymethyldihydropteridine diphosphokinase [Cytophagaceae bacterium DM2B3-1]|uniref:2-amino-4-hydroxy-6-hydroxymethyldihydropteridine pyrophosphokinase n=1 Tax=Xanthocytophaga flava TaxID=3048013 RepID=A0AAE3U9B9_9BACT|nr:2-amino-4-hydroxy-6-hydroxymethyldihydropteridine diphosphokinase [Xanthocytophaga flavus]MDJ1473436.1 2-amino-4-hydroxy-6-hydroxymethyldihydropteridine diphosphokinase [Xanthocytophaga flavus]MDJ1482103.1 2-amino-4-hydroxy-6-hydroxymethyldihydropteridine diphosphokinase [Xanthocytophaga flavus]MDJ1491646.1 2-amino-4-hydroxy-6-hydroxymethyldihydropteridine diphosphokinase [Xanthocytophaga flavus]
MVINTYLLLGTNLGDRKLNIESSLVQIENQIGTIVLRSSIYETEPWGVTDQPNYWNLVVQINTQLTPQEQLTTIHKIEKSLGRERRIRWEARLIDIDILYINDWVLQDVNLVVPHPRIADRRFVLTPLTEIAPDFVHPIWNKTNQELLTECNDSLTVLKIT